MSRRVDLDPEPTEVESVEYDITYMTDVVISTPVPAAGRLGIQEVECSVQTHDLLMPDDRGLHCPVCGAFI